MYSVRKITPQLTVSLLTLNDDIKHVPYEKTPPPRMVVVGGLFWFYRVGACPREKRSAWLLKPFLSFKGYKTTVLIVQNEAEALINNQ